MKTPKTCRNCSNIVTKLNQLETKIEQLTTILQRFLHCTEKLDVSDKQTISVESIDEDCCHACRKPVEIYLDPKLDDWVFKNASIRDNKLYHYACV